MRTLSQRTPDRVQVMVVSMPPRHGKSEYCSKYLPSWFVGTHSDERAIIAGYGTKFASEWGGRCRDLLTELGVWFGVGVDMRSSAKDHWNLLGRRGGMDAAGVGGPLTGKGASLMVIDDPIKNQEEAYSQVYRDKVWDWYQSTASTRLEPDGVVILIQTRWHRDDLAGRIMSRASELGQVVCEIKLPALAEENDILGREPGEALWPERFSQKALEERRRISDVYWWRALYQQDPTEVSGTEWPSHYFAESVFFQDPPPRERVAFKTMALDPSKGRTEKSDFSAFAMCWIDHDGVIWADADLKRRPVEQIVSDAVDLYTDFWPDLFGIEANAFQDLLEGHINHEFERRSLLRREIIPIENRLKKEVRIRSLGYWMKRGMLRFRNNASTRLLVHQMREFPLAKHDDGPDALEMAVRLALEHVGVDPETISGSMNIDG